MHGRTVCLAAIWIWIFHGSSLAQIPFGGRVVDETGRPVSGIEIRLSQSDGSALTKSVTDQDGRFSFSSLPPGAYRLVAERSGYFVLERQFNLKTPILAEVILSPKVAPEDSVTVCRVAARWR
jgi:5-hydroxyisourate hydrolase-like protein (transthyretin family)